MPTTAFSSPQLHLFPGDSPAYQDALARYETLRPVIQGQRTLIQQSHLLRELTRTVRRHGQIRLHNFGLYVERGLWGHTVEVVVYDDMVRIEQAAQQVVSYPCVYDTRQRRITAVDASGRQQYREVPVIQLVLFTLALVRTVWCLPRYRRRQESRQALSAPQMSLLPPFAG